MVEAADLAELAARSNTVKVQSGGSEVFKQYFPLWSARNAPAVAGESGDLAGVYNKPGFYRPAILPEDVQGQPTKYAKRWGINPNADGTGRSMMSPRVDTTAIEEEEWQSCLFSGYTTSELKGQNAFLPDEMDQGPPDLGTGNIYGPLLNWEAIDPVEGSTKEKPQLVYDIGGSQGRVHRVRYPLYGCCTRHGWR